MAKEKVTLLDDDNDFGFTFHDEEDIVSSSGVTTEVDDLKERLRVIRKTYLPLLQHLAKDPEKAMIKWPNRKAVLDKQMTKLIDLTEV